MPGLNQHGSSKEAAEPLMPQMDLSASIIGQKDTVTCKSAVFESSEQGTSVALAVGVTRNELVS